MRNSTPLEFTVRHAIPTDLPALMRTYHDAHSKHSSLYRLLYKDVQVKDLTAGHNFIRRFIDDPQRFATVAVFPSGEVVGFALWSRIQTKNCHPGSWVGYDASPDEVKHDEPAGTNQQVLMEWLGQEDKQLKAWSQSTPSFIYLGDIAVASKCQGGGIGRKLIRSGIRKAESLGDPVHLLSTHEAQIHWSRNSFLQTEVGFACTQDPSIVTFPMRYVPPSKVKHHSEPSVFSFEEALNIGERTAVSEIAVQL